MKASFDNFGNHLAVVSVSPWLMDRAVQSKILSEKNHTIVLNGIDTEVFAFSEAETVKGKYILQGQQMVFHATASFSDAPNHIKGGYYVLELAKRFPDITFVVAGTYTEGIKVPSNVRLLGKISDQKELAQLYSAADVTLLTSKKETFSMITAESLCCGTPVIGFKAGAPEQIAIEEYSTFVEWGDLDAMERALTQALNEKLDKNVIASQAAAKYSKATMAQEYIAIYRRLGENQ